MILLVPWLGQGFKHTVNIWAYPVASLGAGLALMAAGLTGRGRRRWAWLHLGMGIIAWGIGEAGSEVYWAFGREVPYPGWVDIFYLLGYPLLAIGVVLLPRPRLGKYERTRSALDAAAGIIALSLITWTVYLDRAISFDPEASLFTNWVNALYPIGDAVLLLAVLGLALRRTERRLGIQLAALIVALLLNAGADIVYFTAIASAEYTTGMWIDGLWLLGYAAFAAAAWLELRPSQPATDLTAQSRGGVAYVPVVALLGMVLTSEHSTHRLQVVAWLVVAVIIVIRQWVVAREAKELAAEGRDTVLTSVSHDLRIPLSVVQGYAQLLAKDWDSFADAERQEMARIVEDQAAHLAKIVTDIIDLARGRLSSVSLDTRPQPVVPLLRRAAEAFPPDVAAQVTIEADDDLLADADPDRLHQVLVNLLANAMRYGQPPILVRARPDGRHALFQVHDAGPGIPRRFEAAIWDRFERGAHRHDSRIGGLGIGLSTARALVEAHGG
ncbi:MAG: HAMP domain-containing histidine kinase, partial [Gemmatimonadetes bacterium]|nr:HAMP domain-containing histidine kinase [Gemmatimonadota bacterium]